MIRLILPEGSLNEDNMTEEKVFVVRFEKEES